MNVATWVVLAADMHKDMLDLAFSFVVGLAAGAAYLAALWLTVRWFTRGALAPIGLLVSAAIRIALLLVVLFWIMDGQSARLFAALAGFLLVRIATARSIRTDGGRRAGAPGTATTPEVRDATDAR